MKRSTFFKKSIIFVVIVATIASIVGCAPTPNGVNLASKSKILRYVEMEFGKAEYVKKEEKDTSIVYTLKDKQYGFEYTVKTFVQELNIDGSVFGYAENKSNDFVNCYYAYIAEQLENVTPDNLRLEPIEYQEQNNFAKIIVSNDFTPSVIEQIELMSQQISKIDTRGYFANAKLNVENKNNEALGSYSFQNNEFSIQYDDSVSYYMEKAKSVVGQDLLYQRKESVNKSNMEGLSQCNLAHIVGTDNDTKETIDCYYFISNNKEYLIANVFINNSYTNDTQHFVYCFTDHNAIFKEG